MASLKYVKHERVWLKGHSEFTEKWLQDLIAADPSILGLGDDVVLLQRERQQEGAGRLDLLLADIDGNKRYEVELMLGATDESHIIRCIEYWDIERTRYPAYDHSTVIVAEDITSRFLNVLALFSGSIPIIAIQLNALRVEGQIVLDFVKVLDRRSLRTDDVAEAEDAGATKDTWEQRASQPVVHLAERCLEAINSSAPKPLKLSFNRQYIGLNDGTRPQNLVIFRPRKQFLQILAWPNDPEAWKKRLEDAGLPATLEGKGVRAPVYPAQFDTHKLLLNDLFAATVKDNFG